MEPMEPPLDPPLSTNGSNSHCGFYGIYIIYFKAIHSKNNKISMDVRSLLNNNLWLLL